jgi:glycosyltransferase involved in cell wall biosynthesis
MRVGRNPLTRAQAGRRDKVIVSVITHLPNDWQQYHRNRMEVVQLSLLSLKKHTGNIPYHLAIWDNGSHEGFREWLKGLEPDTLVLSGNVGKSVARKALFGMFEPDTIMAMADDDMFYFPNWLKAQVDLLFYFDIGDPLVGTVTGYPVKTSYRWGNESAHKFAQKHGELIKGDFVTQEWDYDFCTSIGRDYDHHIKTSGDVVQYKIKYKEREALAIGHHCQFVCVNGRIAPLLRFDYDAMADEKPFDRAVDENYMRLCTPERYTMHMGNVLDEKLISLANKYRLSVSAGNRVAVSGGRRVAAVDAPAL